MDYSLIAYILLSIVVGGYAVSTLYQRGQTMGAMISLVLLILIFIFYGLRWFQGGSLKGSATQKGQVTWPPIVNMCPDFMVSWKDSNNKVYCYDAGDVYGMRRATAGGSVKGSLNVTGQGATDSALIIKTTDANADPTLLKDDMQSIVRNNKTIRWEGVWDGQKLQTVNIPKPA